MNANILMKLSIQIIKMNVLTQVRLIFQMEVKM